MLLLFTGEVTRFFITVWKSAAEFDGVDDFDLFDAHQFDGIDRWPEFGGEARHFATIRNQEIRHDEPQLKAGRNHEWAFFNFVDERFEP